MKILIIVLYFIFLILFSIFLIILRKKKISKLIEQKEYNVLNKRYLLQTVFGIINLLLLVGIIGVFITEENILYLLMDVVVTMCVNFLLIYIMILYPIQSSFIYTSLNNKLYLIYKGQVLEFDYSRIHFEKKKNLTLMYYKDSLVISTKQFITRPKIK